MLNDHSLTNAACGLRLLRVDQACSLGSFSSIHSPLFSSKPNIAVLYPANQIPMKFQLRFRTSVTSVLH